MVHSRKFGKRRFYLYDSQFRIEYLKKEQKQLQDSGYLTRITSESVGWKLWVWHEDLEKELAKGVRRSLPNYPPRTRCKR